MALAEVACRLPESRVYRVTVEELWRGKLPGIEFAHLSHLTGNPNSQRGTG